MTLPTPGHWYKSTKAYPRQIVAADKHSVTWRYRMNGVFAQFKNTAADWNQYMRTCEPVACEDEPREGKRYQ